MQKKVHTPFLNLFCVVYWRHCVFLKMDRRSCTTESCALSTQEQQEVLKWDKMDTTQSESDWKTSHGSGEISNFQPFFSFVSGFAETRDKKARDKGTFNNRKVMHCKWSSFCHSNMQRLCNPDKKVPGQQYLWLQRTKCHSLFFCWQRCKLDLGPAAFIAQTGTHDGLSRLGEHKPMSEPSQKYHPTPDTSSLRMEASMSSNKAGLCEENPLVGLFPCSTSQR